MSICSPCCLLVSAGLRDAAAARSAAAEATGGGDRFAQREEALQRKQAQQEEEKAARRRSKAAEEEAKREARQKEIDERKRKREEEKEEKRRLQKEQAQPSEAKREKWRLEAAKKGFAIGLRVEAPLLSGGADLEYEGSWYVATILDVEQKRAVAQRTPTACPRRRCSRRRVPPPSSSAEPSEAASPRLECSSAGCRLRPFGRARRRVRQHGGRVHAGLRWR